MRLSARGTPAANGRAVKYKHFYVHGLTRTDMDGYFRRLKYVARSVGDALNVSSIAG
jgi:hypothetical protein